MILFSQGRHNTQSPVENTQLADILMILKKMIAKPGQTRPAKITNSRHLWKAVAFHPKNQHIPEGESGHVARINAD